MNRFSEMIFLMIVFSLAGCGVKGKPLPPLVPPPIGRGEPTYSGATANKKPIKNKYNYKAEENNDDSGSSGE